MVEIPPEVMIASLILPKEDIFTVKFFNKSGVEVKITKDDSKIPCYIIPTNEEVMMARETYEFLK